MYYLTPVTDMVPNNLASLPDSGEVIQKLLELKKNPAQKERSYSNRSVKYVRNDKGLIVFVHRTTKKLKVKVRIKRQKTFPQRVKSNKTYKRKLYPKRKTKCSQ